MKKRDKQTNDEFSHLSGVRWNLFWKWYSSQERDEVHIICEFPVLNTNVSASLEKKNNGKAATHRVLALDPDSEELDRPRAEVASARVQHVSRDAVDRRAKQAAVLESRHLHHHQSVHTFRKVYRERSKTILALIEIKTSK